jgi:hypothetical protein
MIVDLLNVGLAIESIDIVKKLKRSLGRVSVSDQILDIGFGQKRVSGSLRKTPQGTVALAFAILANFIL